LRGDVKRPANHKNLIPFFHPHLHFLVTEAMRRAYRDRALYLGDPEFNADIPKDRLISKAYAAE
jgi:gamma-glutamyltranspeptidase